MTEEHDEIPPAAPERPEEHFLGPVRDFVEAMLATRSLIDFLRANSKSLSDVEKAFAEEARMQFPGDSFEQHQSAATLVHKTIHAAMEAVDSIPEAERTAEASADARAAPFNQLRSALDELTSNPDYFGRYAFVWNRVSARPSGLRMLSGSLLMSIVSDFEVLVSALVRAMLRARPEILRTSERKFTVKELEPFESFEDLREAVSEEFADGLLRGGFSDWMEWFADRQHVVVEGVTDCPVELVEVFQRRHILVHNGGRVNALYLSKIKGLDDAPKLGEQVRVGGRYLDRSVDSLLMAGTKLAVSLALKFAADDGERRRIDSGFNAVTFDLLRREEYKVVEDVNSWHLDLVTDDESRLIGMVNRWLAQKKLRGVDAIRAEVQVWDTRPLASRFRLVQLALLDEVVEAHALARRLLDSEEMHEAEWQTWPVLDGVREHAVATNADLPGNGEWMFDAAHDHLAQDTDSN